MKAMPMHQFLLTKNNPSKKVVKEASTLPNLQVEGLSDDGKEVQLFAQMLEKHSQITNPALSLPGEVKSDLEQSEVDQLPWNPDENKLLTKGSDNKIVNHETGEKISGKVLYLNNDSNVSERLGKDSILKDLLIANKVKKPLAEFEVISDSLRAPDHLSQINNSGVVFLTSKDGVLPSVNKIEMGQQKELIGLDGEKIIEFNQKRQQLMAKSNELKSYPPSTVNAQPRKLISAEYSGKDNIYPQTVMIAPVLRPKDDGKDKNYDYLLASVKNAKANGPGGNTIEIKFSDRLIDPSNPSKLIEKISQIIENNANFQQNSLKINVHHEQLGSFQVQVRPNGNHQGINIEIITNTTKGQEFFQQQEGELLRNLHDAGIKTFDLKLTNSMEFRSEVFAKNFLPADSGERQFSQRGEHQSNQQFEREQDSSRRRNIWQELKERYGA